MPKPIDMTGKRFGKLVVIERHGSCSNRHYTWLCKCDCGKKSIVIGGKLRDGSTRSCGCLRDEVRTSGNTTHGKWNTPEWKAWNNIIQRCTNQNSPAYRNYGGRGISVCSEWRHSFDKFYTDMGKRPSSKHSIDRIENNGNYEPNNCRWTTEKVQQNNKRNNVNRSGSN
jgi:hypothetical protein